MTVSRRWPSATGPGAHSPDPSGPRAAIVSVIRVTATASAAAPAKIELTTEPTHAPPTVPTRRGGMTPRTVKAA